MKKAAADVERASMSSFLIFYFIVFCLYIALLCLLSVQGFKKTRMNLFIYYTPLIQVLISILTLVMMFILNPGPQTKLLAKGFYVEVLLYGLAYGIIFPFYSRKNITIKNEFLKFRLPILIITIFNTLVAITFALMLMKISNKYA